MSEFWNLVKREGIEEAEYRANLDKLEQLLFFNYELLRILSLLLVPYCPRTASDMLSVVGEIDVTKPIESLED